MNELTSTSNCCFIFTSFIENKCVNTQLFADGRIDIIKGIHPGKIIEMELNKKKITQRSLADETDIPYQTINAVIAGRRNLTTGKALRAGNYYFFVE